SREAVIPCTLSFFPDEDEHDSAPSLALQSPNRVPPTDRPVTPPPPPPRRRRWTTNSAAGRAPAPTAEPAGAGAGAARPSTRASAS
uniref:Uncharacterized protein n=1 Tax=Aegilops tauschii subsp. strangulata TaxID=200361 RepID=A0A453QT04_AEGTS